MGGGSHLYGSGSHDVHAKFTGEHGLENGPRPPQRWRAGLDEPRGEHWFSCMANEPHRFQARAGQTGSRLYAGVRCGGMSEVKGDGRGSRGTAGGTVGGRWVDGGRTVGEWWVDGGWTVGEWWVDGGLEADGGAD